MVRTTYYESDCDSQSKSAIFNLGLAASDLRKTSQQIPSPGGFVTIFRVAPNRVQHADWLALWSRVNND